MFELNCEKCGVRVSISNICTNLRDIDGKRLNAHCRECGEITLFELKKSRFVEKYKENDIYEKDVKFSPYCGCSYYFSSLDDCRKRIDTKHLAITNVPIFP